MSLTEEQVNTAIDNYSSKLDAILKKKRVVMLDHQTLTIGISDLLTRSLEERAPFHADDSGLRDSVIWELVLLELNKSKKAVCFISSDKPAFGNGSLHLRLSEEIQNTGVQLFYYNEMEPFLKDYGEKIEFINEAFIEEYLEDIRDELGEQYDSSDFDKDDLSDDHRFQDVDIDNVNFSGAYLSYFYIYHQTADLYFIRVVGDLEYEIDLTITDIDRDGPSWYSDSDTATREFELELTIDKKTKKIVGHERA